MNLVSIVELLSNLEIMNNVYVLLSWFTLIFRVQLAQLVYICGACYFVTFIDAHSHLTWVYVLKDRSQQFNALKTFYAKISNQI